MTPELRKLFPITTRYNYLNHAALSPLPLPALQAVEAQLRDVHENGSVNFHDWLSTKEQARKLLAAMLGAPRPEQVAFMRNTSDSLSTVANGLTWRAGDNVVTFRGEFPSNLYPWLRLREAFGVEVRMCEERNGRIDLDALEKLIDRNTRVVTVSYVQFASGFRIDTERLARAARRHDALFVVDMVQALGVIPLNVEAELIDVAAGTGHKWLMAPEGLGYLYLSDRARERIQPTLVGWVSVPDPFNNSNLDQGWNRGTLAWESGTGPAALFYGLKASLELLTGLGTARIAERLEELSDQLCRTVCERLKARNYELVSSRLPGEKSQVVCIRHKAGMSAMALYAHLKARNIITAPRSDRLRIAPHVYNLPEEIDALIEALP